MLKSLLAKTQRNAKFYATAGAVVERAGKLCVSPVSVASCQKPCSASYGRVFLGALCPSQSLTSVAAMELLVASAALKKGQLDPAGEIVQ